MDHRRARVIPDVEPTRDAVPAVAVRRTAVAVAVGLRAECVRGGGRARRATPNERVKRGGNERGGEARKGSK